LNKEDAMDRCKWRKMIKEARWSGWVWVGECSFWYRPTRVVPDQRPLNGRRCCCCCFDTIVWHQEGYLACKSFVMRCWLDCLKQGVNFLCVVTTTSLVLLLPKKVCCSGTSLPRLSWKWHHWVIVVIVFLTIFVLFFFITKPLTLSSKTLIWTCCVYLSTDDCWQ